MISAILGISDNNAIGFKGGLPWPHIPDDMRWFKNTTLNQVVVMGRNTWQGLGIIKPLKNRVNIVISSTLSNLTDAQVITDNINDEILKLETTYPDKEIFIIGGPQIWNVTWPIIKKFYITRVRGKYDADVFFDVDLMLTGTELVYNEYMQKENQPALDFQIWKRT
jgi:dihydrofolate reductase